jgi:hypothetical protein
MLRRRLLVLSLTTLPAVPALAQPWWGSPAERQREYEAYRQEEMRRRNAAARHERWEEAREHQRWEAQRRAELQREWQLSHRGPPPPTDRHW